MINIAPQAIDQATNRVLKIWNESRAQPFPSSSSEPEGLYSWLQRICQNALEDGEHLPSGKVRYMGMKFTFMPMSVQHGTQHSIGHVLQSIERIR